MRIPVRSLPIVAACLLLAAQPVFSQSDFARDREATLKQQFEGKSVVVKIDMPGTSDGVEINPGASPDIKLDDYRRRLGRYPVAIRAGQTATITKIKLKDKLIEFHLDGGGYGSDVSVSDYVSPTPKSEREKNLEKDLKQATDEKQRRSIKEQIDDLKRRREYLDTVKQREAREHAADEHERRMTESARGGSRFNIVFPRGTPVEDFTPSWLTRVLARYIDFGDQQPADFSARRPGPETRQPVAGPSALRKGMSREEVDDLLGKPDSLRSAQEGRLATTTCTYSSRTNQVIEALFVEGVLVRYTISSR